MTTFPNRTHYSANFSRRELDCRCGCRTPPAVAVNLAELAQYLEQLRALLNVPMHIHCAYRCKKHNAAIGGAPASKHMTGLAADFSAKKHTPVHLVAQAERIPRFKNGGLHAYSWGTHVDIRKDGPARW